MENVYTVIDTEIYPKDKGKALKSPKRKTKSSTKKENQVDISNM